MKRLIAVILLWLLPVATPKTFCQDINFGIKTGLAVNSYTSVSGLQGSSGNYKYTSDLKAGFTGGIYVRFPVHERISVQTELLLSRKGGRTDSPSSAIFFSDNEFTLSEEVSLLYLDLPLYLQYEISSEGSIRPHLISGVFAGYYLDGKMKSVYTETLNGQVVLQKSAPIFFSHDMKSLNYGLMIGGGIKKNPLTFDVIYEYGLADITNSTTIENDRRINRNNLTGFTVRAGYDF